MTLEKIDKDLEKVQQKIDKLAEPLERMQAQMKQLLSAKKTLEQSRTDLVIEMENEEIVDCVRGLNMTTAQLKAHLEQLKNQGGPNFETL